MGYVQIGLADVAVSLSLILIVLYLSFRGGLGMERDVSWGALRAFAQLMLVGYILKFVFDLRDWRMILLILGVMIVVAGYNGARRQREGFSHFFRIITLSILIGTVVTLALVMYVVIKVKPWYAPQYIIPIAGMIIGNSMNGASLTVNRLRSDVSGHRLEVEAALALGAPSRQAVERYIKDAVKAAMIPTINAMMVVGIVQLPGMMTGQIIGGVKPEDAVMYQVVVMYMISSATAITCMTAAFLTYRGLFTRHHQLMENI